MIFILIRC